MKKKNAPIRIDPELRERANELFISLGMDLSTATTVFYLQALRCNGIPFEIRAEEPNDVTYAAIEAAENDEDLSEAFDSVEDLMVALNA